MNSQTAGQSTPASPLILVFAETLWGKVERLTFELLSDARKLATSVKGRVEIILFTSKEQKDSLLNELLVYAREPIHLVEQENFAEYSTESYTSGLVQLLQVLKPNILFLGATTYGRDFGPHAAARLGCAYFPHCLLIKATAGKLDITRVTHGGRVHIQANWPLTDLAIFTMKAGVADAPPAEKTPPNPVVIPHSLTIAASRVRLKKRIPPDPKTLDIRQAEKLIAGGRGVGNSENFIVLRSLADAIGASLAASRAAVDLGWIEYERQVGQTGKTVAPRLYLAAGISGASHHLMGMRDAGKIVVVNTDRKAPIFSVAHFGVLGDLHTVLPRLTQRIQSDKNKAAPLSK